MDSIDKIFLKKYQPYIWLIGLGLLLYLPIIWFDFIYLDDNVLILRDIRTLTDLGNIAQIFKQGVFNILHTGDTYYRPMPTLSLMLDAQISGADPSMYHLTNILLHLANACLIFILLQKFGFKKSLALIASIFFVVHPVLVSSVAWIMGRNDSLLALFVMLSFLCLINFLKEDYTGRSMMRLALHQFFFLLALLTKENALVVPLVIIVYFWFFDPKINIQDRFFTQKKVIIYALWLAIIAIYFLARKNALGSTADIDSLSIAKNLITTLPALLVYFGKIVLPINLSGYPIMKDSSWILGLVALVPFVALYLFGRKPNYKMTIFGVVWFLVFLVPSLLRADLNPNMPFLENRLYLPMFGILLIILGSNFLAGSFKTNYMKLTATLVIIGFYALSACLYSKTYQDKIVFWENAKAHSPSSAFVHNNLGAMYFIDGKVNEAGVEFTKASSINDLEPLAHGNMGLVYLQLGQYDQAEREIKKELSFNPKYSDAYYNLGLVYAKQNKFADATLSWEKTIELNPDYLDAYAQLVNHYSNTQKDAIKAKYYFDEYTRRGGAL